MQNPKKSKLLIYRIQRCRIKKCGTIQSVCYNVPIHMLRMDNQVNLRCQTNSSDSRCKFDANPFPFFNRFTSLKLSRCLILNNTTFHSQKNTFKKHA